MSTRNHRNFTMYQQCFVRDWISVFKRMIRNKQSIYGRLIFYLWILSYVWYMSLIFFFRFWSYFLFGLRLFYGTDRELLSFRTFGAFKEENYSIGFQPFSRWKNNVQFIWSRRHSIILYIWYESDALTVYRKDRFTIPWWTESIPCKS